MIQMNRMDWKDKLSMLQASMPAGEKDQEPVAPASDEGRVPKFHGRVKIFFEKKGRGGKCATILVPDSLDEAGIKELSKFLKTKFAVGGSCRGGEILLQGDLREALHPVLGSLGFSK